MELPSELVMPEGWYVEAAGARPVYKRVGERHLRVFFNGFANGWVCVEKDYGVQKWSAQRNTLLIPGAYPTHIAAMVAAEFALAGGDP